MTGLGGMSLMDLRAIRCVELAHPAMHHSIPSLGCSSGRSCDHPKSEGDPEAALEVSVLARRLLRDCRMPFARELAGPPLWPVVCWLISVQLRTTTPASYVCLCWSKSTGAQGSMPMQLKEVGCRVAGEAKLGEVMVL